MPLMYGGGSGYGAIGNEVTDAAGLLQGLRGPEDAFGAQLGVLSHVFDGGGEYGVEPVTEVTNRCSRQNGLGWQCASLALPNRRYCEKHVGQKSRTRKTNGVQLGGGRSLSDKAPHPNAKKRPPPGMCRRTNGQGWWCKRAAVIGTTFCQNHLDSIRKQRETRANRAEQGPTPSSTEQGKTQGLTESVRLTESVNQVEGDEDKPLWELSEVRNGPPPPVSEGASEGEEKATEDTRCKRQDGRKWQCSKERLLGRPYCKEHTERDRKKREAAKKSGKRKRDEAAVRQREGEAEPPLRQAVMSADAMMEAEAPLRQGVMSAEAMMSLGELLLPMGGYQDQLIRLAPAGLQAAGMPLPSRSAFTPVANHGSAFTPVATHAFGGHAFVPVSRGALNKNPAQQQGGFALYGEGSFHGGGAFLFRDEITHNGGYRLGPVQEVPVRTCQHGDGRGWACALRAVEGGNLCEKHLAILGQKLSEEELAQQAMAEHQEGERRAYGMFEDVQHELLMQGALMQGMEMPANLYTSDTPRFGSILSM